MRCAMCAERNIDNQVIRSVNLMEEDSKITTEQKRRIMKSLVWDNDVREDRLLEILLGLRDEEGTFDQERVFLRVLERMPWHEILGLMGKDRVARLLTPETIQLPNFVFQDKEGDMSEQGEYYKENLYAFQDGILSIVKGIDAPFYLTGGTAISRHYSPVRYSDDLDLFVNLLKSFPRQELSAIKWIEPKPDEGFLIGDLNTMADDIFSGVENSLTAKGNGHS